MNCLLYADGSRIDSNKVVGNGVDGFVILTGNTVLKVPKLYGTYRDGAVEYVDDGCHSPEDLEQEKKIYARLQNTDGVAKCIETSLIGITLEYYPNGSLEQYINSSNEAEPAQKQRWMSEIVDVVASCHAKRVLIFDIALRNFLLAKDWSIKIIDFANSVLFSEDIDMSTADDGGCTANLDMLHLGNVIYSIATWHKFSVDCAMESEWPDLSQMPPTEDIAFGYIIANCWQKRYTGIHELQQDLKRANGVESRDDNQRQFKRDPRIGRDPLNIAIEHPRLINHRASFQFLSNSHKNIGGGLTQDLKKYIEKLSLSIQQSVHCHLPQSPPFSPRILLAAFRVSGRRAPSFLPIIR
nr:putative camp-dependent protein kinase catalytic subunit [Quercus suber]